MIERETGFYSILYIFSRTHDSLQLAVRKWIYRKYQICTSSTENFYYSNDTSTCGQYNTQLLWNILQDFHDRGIQTAVLSLAGIL